MLLIKNGIVHTMDKSGTLRADLLSADGKIKKISGHIEEEEADVFDASDSHIYPGLIDAHSHIGVSEEKVGSLGDDCNETTTPVTPQLRALDAINPMDSAFHNALAAGITAVMAGPGSSNPIGGQFALIKTYGRRADDMIIKAPSAIKIAFGENPKTNYGANGNMPSSRMSVAAMIREELFRARDYFNQNNPKMDFKLEAYRELFEKKIPLKAHAHRADDIFTAIRIAKEFDLRLTIDHCTEGHLIAEEIAASGAPAIIGPSMASRSKIEVEQSDFKTPAILHRAGVLIALTTDHPVTRIQHLPICAALAAKNGLGEKAAMRAITADAAKICGAEDRIGSIALGKDADFAIFNGNPLEIKTNLLAAVIDGKIVYRHKG